MGKPGGGHAPSSPAEYIGRMKRTEGTETSQYLQEEKETSISRVAASERETAETVDMLKPAGVVSCGVVGPVLDLCCRQAGESQTCLLAEQSGKADQRR